MKIEKKETAKRDVPPNTFTAQQATMILNGVTDCVTASSQELMVSLNGFYDIVIHPVKSGRKSRYEAYQIFAARDCCVLVNGLGHNLSYCYTKAGDWIHAIFLSRHPSEEDFEKLNGIVGEHLKKMLLKLEAADGGFCFVKMDGFDEHFSKEADGFDEVSCEGIR